MFEISIDVLLEKADSLYKLVSVAANRAREIDRTGYLQKEENFYKTKKSLGRALEEIAAGLIIIE
ncbi:MAG TPA: DNA-directed RNA polymerase subunit omega [Tenericutes bacterium]|jgi:DNA-directed RNA polymerase subunit omega|nr:DNA-directed RNA polymerase subunit omega [Mycoplasmatota bacterium]